MTDDITAFITAQLDREEKLARAAQDLMMGDWSSNKSWDTSMWGDGPDDDHPYANHIAAHDPARTLRDIEFKRGLVDAFIEAVNEVEERGQDVFWYGVRHALTNAVLDLASRWSDQPGYQQEWAVE